MSDLKTTPIETLTKQFEEYFQKFVRDRYGRLDPLDEVVAYVLGGAGKRVRPILALLATEAVGGQVADAMPVACALEMIHSYSLTHDDLPCMDDDDLRRGRPTAHKRFDEGRALLAGDALLTDSFGVLAEHYGRKPHMFGSMIAMLADAIGGRGMVWGQTQDLHWTGRGGATKVQLDAIHRTKTGALIGAACGLGALAGGAPDEVADALRGAGERLGLAFQVVDDLLDSREGTGKTKGKDQASGKLTYVSAVGREEAERLAKAYTDDVVRILRSLGPRMAALIEFSEMLLKRSK